MADEWDKEKETEFFKELAPYSAFSVWHGFKREWEENIVAAREAKRIEMLKKIEDKKTGAHGAERALHWVARMHVLATWVMTIGNFSVGFFGMQLAGAYFGFRDWQAPNMAVPVLVGVFSFVVLACLTQSGWGTISFRQARGFWAPKFKEWGIKGQPFAERAVLVRAMKIGAKVVAGGANSGEKSPQRAAHRI